MIAPVIQWLPCRCGGRAQRPRRPREGWPDWEQLPATWARWFCASCGTSYASAALRLADVRATMAAGWGDPPPPPLPTRPPHVCPWCASSWDPFDDEAHEYGCPCQEPAALRNFLAPIARLRARLRTVGPCLELYSPHHDTWELFPLSPDEMDTWKSALAVRGDDD